MYIFLDDERKPVEVFWIRMLDIPHCQWTIVRSYDEFVALLKDDADIKHISFDHDLAEQHYGHGLDEKPIDYQKFTEKTGFDCAKALIEWCLEHGKDVPDYVVHSLNPVGSDNIRGLLENFKNFSKKEK